MNWAELVFTYNCSPMLTSITIVELQSSSSASWYSFSTFKVENVQHEREFGGLHERFITRFIVGSIGLVNAASINLVPCCNQRDDLFTYDRFRSSEIGF